MRRAPARPGAPSPLRRAAGVLACAVAAAGCSRTVGIVSEPPGARVVVNNAYIGDTPVTTTFRLTADGTLGDSYEVVAYPPQGHPTGATRYRYFRRWDKPPERIYFDFRPSDVP